LKGKRPVQFPSKGKKKGIGEGFATIKETGRGKEPASGQCVI